MARIAVVLMNLGGPDSLDAVEPFLFNLFSDPAIIRLPAPLRLPLARMAARGRARVACRIYAQLGGGSPLLANTEVQARALETVLGGGYRAFVAMRYWHPESVETARAVAAWAPDEIVCLPLYPQFSTTTTASSLDAWGEAAARCGLDTPSRVACSYPDHPGFIEAIAGLLRPVLAETAAGAAATRLLLTAHGLPKRTVRGGDPYPDQVEITARAVIRALADPDLDWRLCYQSRIGPLAWLGPSVVDEIRRAGADRVPLVVVPISFVSEHSETLVELDHDYRRVAESCGVPAYRRVATVGVEPRFIAALASLVRSARPISATASVADPVCRFAEAER